MWLFRGIKNNAQSLVTSVNSTTQDNPCQERRLVFKKYHIPNSRDLDFSVSNNMASVKEKLCLIIDFRGILCAKEISSVWNEVLSLNEYFGHHVGITGRSCSFHLCDSAKKGSSDTFKSSWNCPSWNYWLSRVYIFPMTWKVHLFIVQFCVRASDPNVVIYSM